MNVTVKLYGALRRYRPATTAGMTSAAGAAHHPFTMTLANGEEVATLLADLGIPDAALNAVAVNGKQANQDTTLQDGDTVHLFPPAAGG